MCLNQVIIRRRRNGGWGWWLRIFFGVWIWFGGLLGVGGLGWCIGCRIFVVFGCGFARFRLVGAGGLGGFCWWDSLGLRVLGWGGGNGRGRGFRVAVVDKEQRSLALKLALGLLGWRFGCLGFLKFQGFRADFWGFWADFWWFLANFKGKFSSFLIMGWFLLLEVESFTVFDYLQEEYNNFLNHY